MLINKLLSNHVASGLRKLVKRPTFIYIFSTKYFIFLTDWLTDMTDRQIDRQAAIQTQSDREIDSLLVRQTQSDRL